MVSRADLSEFLSSVSAWNGALSYGLNLEGKVEREFQESPDLLDSSIDNFYHGVYGLATVLSR